MIEDNISPVTEKLMPSSSNHAERDRSYFRIPKAVFFIIVLTAALSIVLAGFGFLSSQTRNNQLHTAERQAGAFSEALTAICNEPNIASNYRSQCDVAYDYSDETNNLTSQQPAPSSSVSQPMKNVPTKPVSNVSCNADGTLTITYEDKTTRVVKAQCSFPRMPSQHPTSK